jgi:hypothetical protein
MDLDKTAEVIDRIKSELGKAREDFHNGLMSQTPNLCEHYLRSEIGITVIIGKRQGQKVAAVFNISESNTVDEIQIGALIGSEVRHNAQNDDELMLVSDVEIVDDRQGVVRRVVPSVIRLHAFDKNIAAFSDALYASNAFGLVFLGVRENWELYARTIDGLGVCDATCNDELPYEMVKAGAKVMDSLPGDNADSSDRRLEFGGLESRAIAALPSLKVYLTLNSAGGTFSETANGVFEVLDVLVGPLNLDPNRIEWMSHGDA